MHASVLVSIQQREFRYNNVNFSKNGDGTRFLNSEICVGGLMRGIYEGADFLNKTFCVNLVLIGVILDRCLSIESLLR